MAGRRSGRSETRSDPAVVRALQACRGAMTDVSRGVRPFGPAYRAAGAVIAAIDAFAILLTGDRDYFHEIGPGSTAGQVAEQRDQAARERGEKPWR